MVASMTLDVSVTDRGALGGIPGAGLNAKVRTFVQSTTKVQVDAAATATRVSRANVKRKRELVVRAGRFHGLRDAIEWKPTRTGGVNLQVSRLDAEFKPWEVQEIGTGQKAVRHVGGTPNPRGRPAAGARYVRSVRSQVGRRITPGLVFASGGKYSPPSDSTRTQQLHLRSEISDAPVRFDPETRRSAPGIRIGREIEGQHFIQKGGQAGFREYKTGVLAAARSQLRKRRT